jgi:hypothetical protein
MSQQISTTERARFRPAQKKDSRIVSASRFSPTQIKRDRSRSETSVGSASPWSG